MDINLNIKLNGEKVLELLKDFYSLTNLRTVIFDNLFNKLASYPEDSCNFCAMLKTSDIARKKCSKSDKEACLICQQKKSLYVYKCHLGLVEVVAPIKMNDTIIGYIMFGQIIERASKKQNKEQILSKASAYINNEKLEEYYDKIVSKTDEQIKSASKILETCACYLWITEVIKIDTNNLFYHISNYINNHIREELTVEKICKEFGISRNKLYEISNGCFGMSIAKYIKKKRIEIAKKYLAQHNLAVSEVADMAGFYDYNYFSKIFKKETGITPCKFRNQEKNR